MNKNYSIILSREDFNVLRKYLKETKVIYEASSIGIDVYVSMNVDIKQCRDINMFIEYNM